MPELPEVEVVRRGVQQWANNAHVTAVEILDQRSLRRHVDGPEDFIFRLVGQRLEASYRRGKYLWIAFDEGYRAIVIHLGMSGQVLVSDPDIADPKHLKIRITICRDDRVQELRFVDQRIFGGLYLDTLVPAQDHPEELIPQTVAHIGRDPLDPLFSAEAMFRRLRKKKSSLKRALLDQSVSSGIGNIYADEALFRARLHYARPTETLTRNEVSRVYTAAEQVMRLALAQGGTSFDTLYVNVNGESGYFDRSLNVYGREGKPCLVCRDDGTYTLIVRQKFMNRSSYYCPKCQPVPRRARW
ncbi:bifunctional DNA-formamidopyrimidine glycosylase/DNA-(apurinic or apyrimidinic site) lyase [Enteractinococcus helveticum]|uniref:Formamidopyrimidine-DNA glycosylase n=1 Tax=Enteractinococcus helveticum TaxID=1837282 RepID=A0A1B7LUS1_9MICC|nr:bifunctional DNA-formamidopyrimidine glycosylase/DNA-(apurinic or apyrimidinic site) lyase [Enteractinococcus helveticum]OAV51207.1 DNA-formamidopyrimidine glycosylase [Enteractinococcus helveticum]